MRIEKLNKRILYNNQFIIYHFLSCTICGAYAPISISEHASKLSWAVVNAITRVNGYNEFWLNYKRNFDTMHMSPLRGSFKIVYRRTAYVQIRVLAINCVFATRVRWIELINYVCE